MMDNKLFILGAGGHARETYFHLKDINPSIEILFIDDVTATMELNLAGKKVEVVKTWENVKSKITEGYQTFTIGIGYPQFKRQFVAKALAHGLVPAKTWKHPTAVVQNADLGVGGMISPGAVITCNIKIGDYVTINYNVSVGHDSIIGNYSSLNPGAKISGNVTIGEECMIGAGAAILEKTNITNRVVIGANACVTKTIKDEEATYVGVPARRLK